MDIQRLRNWTTGQLHTEFAHLYEDAAYFTGEDGIMTHQLPNALKAIEPWLREKVADPRFWDDQYDPNHVGEYDIAPMTADERAAFFERYVKLPSLLAGKKVIGVVV